MNEYALLSNIIMGSDRYLYVEVFGHNKEIVDEFARMIVAEKGSIVEQSSTEIVSRLPSKNDAIRIAVEMISLGMEKGIGVRAAAE